MVVVEVPLMNNLIVVKCSKREKREEEINFMNVDQTMLP